MSADARRGPLAGPSLKTARRQAKQSLQDRTALAEAELRVSAARANVLAIFRRQLTRDSLEPTAELLARAGLFLRDAT